MFVEDVGSSETPEPQQLPMTGACDMPESWSLLMVPSSIGSETNKSVSGLDRLLVTRPLVFASGLIGLVESIALPEFRDAQVTYIILRIMHQPSLTWSCTITMIHTLHCNLERNHWQEHQQEIVLWQCPEFLQTAISSSDRPLLQRTETVLCMCRCDQFFMVLVTMVMDMIREPTRPSQPPTLDRTCP